jgi:hypothetical protein
VDLRETNNGVDPNTHWYYQSKIIPLKRFSDRILEASSAINLLDIGAGSGYFAYELIKSYPANIQQVVLVDQEYPSPDNELLDGKQIIKEQHLPERIQNSLLLLMDVLEHIEDDGTFLAEVKKKCDNTQPNHFFITVPAFQYLWSRHDVYLKHHRRYTLNGLCSLLRAHGFEIQESYYLYGSLLPLVFIKRSFDRIFSGNSIPSHSDLKPLPSWLNRLLLRYCRLEMSLTRYNKWFGLTCVAAGRC